MNLVWEEKKINNHCQASRHLTYERVEGPHNAALRLKKKVLTIVKNVLFI